MMRRKEKEIANVKKKPWKKAQRSPNGLQIKASRNGPGIKYGPFYL